MKKASEQTLIISLRICVAVFIAALISLVLFSFTVVKINSEIFKQLGMSKTEGEQKITNSILGGYFDQYGARNAKNIALGNRTAVVKDLLVYTRQFVNSPAFIKEYMTIKENAKPKPYVLQTPDEMRNSQVEAYKKSITETEASMKRSDPSMKKMFEDILVSARKQLKEAEDPNNKSNAGYRKGYPELLKSAEASNKQALEEWETKYPANHLLFVKRRLEEFLQTTADIDFNAALIEKNGKKYFVNQEYEKQKGNRWKMAFRAGKEVVLPAREFVQQWIIEIK